MGKYKKWSPEAARITAPSIYLSVLTLFVSVTCVLASISQDNEDIAIKVVPKANENKGNVSPNQQRHRGVGLSTTRFAILILTPTNSADAHKNGLSPSGSEVSGQRRQ